MKVLSTSKVSRVDWWRGKLHVGPRRAALTGTRKVRAFGSWDTVRDAPGSGLRIAVSDVQLTWTL